MGVEFEISYSGLSNFEKGQIERISVKFKEVDQKISAYFDAAKSNGERLVYRIEDKQGARLREVITVPIDLAQTMRLELRTVKEVEMNNRLIMHENRSISQEKRMSWESFSIHQLVLPTFKEGLRYRIQVVNDSTSLYASVCEVDQASHKIKPLKQIQDLIEAVKKGDLAGVKEILNQNKSQANGRDDLGLTPLAYAARDGHTEIVKYLFQEIGVDPDVGALVLAARTGNFEIVQLFLSKKNIDINGQDSYGMTALMAASERGFEKIVKLLLAYDGIKVNTGDSLGLTALMLAEKPEVVELLLKDSRINSSAKDYEGNTAQKRAEIVKNQELIKVFEKYSK